MSKNQKNNIDLLSVSSDLSHKVFLLCVLFLCFSLNACSSLKSSGETVKFDEDTKGPGLFSGSKGSFSLLNRETEPQKTVVTTVDSTQSTSINEMSLKETSRTLEERIQRLERDKIELELLKSRIDKELAK